MQNIHLGYKIMSRKPGTGRLYSCFKEGGKRTRWTIGVWKKVKGKVVACKNALHCAPAELGNDGFTLYSGSTSYPVLAIVEYGGKLSKVTSAVAPIDPTEKIAAQFMRVVGVVELPCSEDSCAHKIDITNEFLARKPISGRCV